MSVEVNWAKLYVPPPPGEHQPPCAGKAHLFDIDHRMAAALSRHYTTGTALRVDYAAQIDVALRYCATCPLAVQQWCDRTATRAYGSRVSIITGGKVYTRGKVVWDLARHLRRAAAEVAA
jgi:hypothetical protein